MASCLLHRGPDDHGSWEDPAAGVALAHRRLAIIDLSHHGHQPMVSRNGRFALTYNGEIYNHHDFRRSLEALGQRLRGSSDTEVLLEAIATWGVDEALRRANGMFALAVWDRAEHALHLARDRIGEKPLYYGWVGGRFLFGSELKALRAGSGASFEVDRDALCLYLRYGYVPTPRSIFQGISKLPPGTIATLHKGSRAEPEIRSYWSAREVVLGAVDNRVPSAQATERLDAALRKAVRLRMEADVPLGAFLSGGVDSSTVVALMQAQSSRPVRTFSIGFEEQSYDEAPFAAAVAHHLGADHTELYVTAKSGLDLLPRLPEIWDEPFADSSQIPTHLLARLTREHVTVALSGDGGDELFLGYPRFVRGPQLERWATVVPPSLARYVRDVMAGQSAGWWARTADRAAKVGVRADRERLGRRARMLTEVLASSDLSEVHRNLVSHWTCPEAIVIEGREPLTLAADSSRWPRLDHPAEQLAYVDLMSYLPDDVLTKVDRATMAVGLEARVPFLDPTVIDMAFRIRPREKLRRGRGKLVLRNVLERYVPPDLVERPKAGFDVPVAHWLRGSLHDWACDLLNPGTLRSQGFFEAGPIEAVWEAHREGAADNAHLLWPILMFQAWFAAQRGT